ncbi:MAG: hypothetical protein LBD89_05130 [Tannerellaceae bacterium]|jgi:hypothetical protein|nr:hypothetical protein [Tannerellaceae bacterium]
MKRQIAFILMISALPILFGGCRKSMKDFSFHYSMESVNNYKVAFSFDSKKTYKIEKYNYFMDNHANRQDPVIQEGSFTDEEYREAVKYLVACNFFRMKDSYGFDKEPDDYLGNIIYQITFRNQGREKFISIRNNDENLFPATFIDLLKYVGNFLKTHPLP